MGIMRKKICPWEKDVVEALQRKKLSQEMNEHLSKCTLCKNVIAVYEWMNRYTERSWSTEMAEKILPHPDAIWDRAHARRRSDKRLVKKALKPLAYAQFFSYGVIIMGVILLLLSYGEKIGNIMGSRIIAQILPIFFIPMLIILISMAFCTLVVIFEKRKKTV